MIVGILGVGHLAASMLAGFLRSGLDPAAIVLSPRGKAAALCARHGFRLATDNRDLVERSDVVIVAVRPAHAPDAVAGLPWRKDQVVVSVCAGVPLSRFAVAPARAVRAMPFTASEICASPTIYFPDIEQAQAVLDRLGPSIALASETDFEVATVNAAVYGWVQDLIRKTAEWSSTQGLDPATGRRLTALTFVAAGRLIEEKDQPMDQMLEELVTPGGITERGLQVLSARGVPAAWEEACTAVLDKLMGPD
ncbi:pyrroline-5-carboxylate reductase [Mesorhizobium loti]|uniref:Pyrroline-5-carboxylate reductase n=1 Tax=Rhizobium loti TaxID=381 RepID=A0A8E3B725_RHILI|nr:NAD(P)-binding domain-containing protein [Mesorhizobium loti]PWJ93398.1 pyrroline-5-carboxylate reductase [Mesorhizobium loti]